MENLINTTIELFSKNWFYMQFLPIILISSLVLACLWELTENEKV